MQVVHTTAIHTMMGEWGGEELLVMMLVVGVELITIIAVSRLR